MANGLGVKGYIVEWNSLAVPNPGTAALLAVGLCAAVRSRARRRQKDQTASYNRLVDAARATSVPGPQPRAARLIHPTTEFVGWISEAHPPSRTTQSQFQTGSSPVSR